MGQISLGEFIMMIVTAAIFDLMQFFLNLFVVTILLANLVGIAATIIFGLWFWLKGVKKAGIDLGVATIMEQIPVINALPAYSGLVIRTYLKNKSEI